jgi:hypothetical protein
MYEYNTKYVVTSNGTHGYTETVKELKGKYVSSASSTNVLGHNQLFFKNISDK